MATRPGVVGTPKDVEAISEPRAGIDCGPGGLSGRSAARPAISFSKGVALLRGARRGLHAGGSPAGDGARRNGSQSKVGASADSGRILHRASAGAFSRSAFS